MVVFCELYTNPQKTMPSYAEGIACCSRRYGAAAIAFSDAIQTFLKSAGLTSGMAE